MNVDVPAKATDTATGKTANQQTGGLDEPVAELRHVSKWYGPVLGLNDVSLALGKGITGLVGPNGAGKSTLIRLVTGHLRPDQGQVRVCGLDAWSWRARRLVGYCPEIDCFYEEMTGFGFVSTLAQMSGFDRAAARQRAARALQRVGLRADLSLRLRGYSKGMRQRVKVAQALLHDPVLLVLDEPFNGVDPVGRQQLEELFLDLAQTGCALLISSHELELVERLTDRIVVVARGQVLAEGNVHQIRSLLQEFPLSVRLQTPQPRRLGASLLALPDVLGVQVDGHKTIVVRVRNSGTFFHALSRVVLAEQHQIEELEILDSSVQAVLGYLLQRKT
ncbi:MAG: ABC transporter ATP-binding protein [Gemmataceae bacterium]